MPNNYFMTVSFDLLSKLNPIPVTTWRHIIQGFYHLNFLRKKYYWNLKAQFLSLACMSNPFWFPIYGNAQSSNPRPKKPTVDLGSMHTTNAQHQGPIIIGPTQLKSPISVLTGRACHTLGPVLEDLLMIYKLVPRSLFQKYYEFHTFCKAHRWLD